MKQTRNIMPFLKHLLVILTILAPTVTRAQSTDVLGKEVVALCREGIMKHASLSVSVYNIDKKTPVYSYNSQQSMIPASLVKLFTTAAGFDKLGDDFRFRTTLAYAGEIDKSGTLHGDIYIIGGGDPLLGSYRYRQTMPDTLFATWQKSLSSAGIKAVNGRIYFDESIFDSHSLHDNWLWGDIGNYYGCGVSGLNFHENMFFVHFTPGAKVGYPASVSRTEPAGVVHHIINEVMTGPSKSGDNVVVYGDPESTLRTCSGTVPLDVNSLSVRASMPNPGQACADLFTAYLRKHKISVSGAASKSLKRPSGLTTLLEYTSPTYYIIAQYTNKTSNNIYAEAIHRYLGYKSSGIGGSASGAKAVGDYLQRLRLESSGIRLEDGCGLSEHNRVTADFVCRFLVEMASQTYFEQYRNSLSKVGEYGTAKNLVPGLPSNVTAYVKTGTMTGVRNYAGYITTAKGERLCFSIIANNFDCTGSQMKTKLEKIIMKIATLE